MGERPILKYVLTPLLSKFLTSQTSRTLSSRWVFVKKLSSALVWSFAPPPISALHPPDIIHVTNVLKLSQFFTSLFYYIVNLNQRAKTRGRPAWEQFFTSLPLITRRNRLGAKSYLTRFCVMEGKAPSFPHMHLCEMWNGTKCQHLIASSLH